MPGTWLEGITAVDLDIHFAAGVHFAATQEMSEEFRQEISYHGAFGTDGPVLRRVRVADEGTVTFSVILLKDGAGKLNDEKILRTMRDFEITCIRGNVASTHSGCNWNRITVRSTLDQVTLDCDISVPGYQAPS